MRSLFAARGFMSVLAVLVAAVAVVAGYVVIANPMQPMQRYCAQLPDSIGLYPGSSVRVRGVVVGTVAGLRPENGSVRVDFNIDADYGLHGDVSAATAAPSLAADRDLAVLPGASTAPRWDPSRCITRTLTPKSITETLQAANNLVKQLRTGDDPQLIGHTLEALRSATTGTGPQVKQILGSLGSALRSPDVETGQIGGLIDALGVLAAGASANWADLEQVLTRFPAVFEQINNEIFTNLTALVDSLRVILAMVNDLTREYGGAILGGLDAVVPYVRTLATGGEPLQQTIARLPALATAFTRATDPDGVPVLAWSPPKVELPQPVSEQLCVAANSIMPGRCAGPDSLPRLNLAELIATTGAR
ncbi:MlaD family protein [Nocardia acidivorans]|uniref:MlaD family protein n=1 Tax=Nocardia acidivorans TaxID=404580 RepID=UPI00082CF017|nr:MlaD family protein [Nocardia acidivorans]